MKICKIWIKDWDQFKDIELDFTDPETGEPADKICFIGSNGTGKSKLLMRLYSFLTNLSSIGISDMLGDILIIAKENNNIYCFASKKER